jgi:hypothetical protein
LTAARQRRGSSQPSPVDALLFGGRCVAIIIHGRVPLHAMVAWPEVSGNGNFIYDRRS